MYLVMDLIRHRIHGFGLKQNKANKCTQSDAAKLRR